jgi:pimeloyl-ACP methyl ester carboxylesterase
LAVALSRYLPQVPRLLSISGPGFVDAALRRGLVPLVSALESGQLGDALRLLAERVAPLGHAPRAHHLDTLGSESGLGELAVRRRMLAGFRLLLELDVRAQAASYAGELLGLVGELSQLATTENQAFTPGPRRRLVRVPGAGMRVLRDAPEFAMQAIEGWLKT